MDTIFGILPEIMITKYIVNAAQEARIRYLYRDMVLKGKLRISFESARKIIGPDCAYHLYTRADLKRPRSR